MDKATKVIIGLTIVGGAVLLLTHKSSAAPGGGGGGGNVITFGTPTGKAVQAVDQNNYPLSWDTLQMSCQISNQGPATTRTIQIWESIPAYPQQAPQAMYGVSVDIPGDSSVTFSYDGNPTGSGSILLQSGTTYEFWLKDVASGATSAKISVAT